MDKTNNDKNVYVLGAGFSKGLGIPLQDDFLLLAKEVYFKNANKFKHFQSVFDYQNNSSKMRQFLSYPLLNLEHLFNLLEMDLFYTNSSELINVKADFIRLICDVLTELTPSPYHRQGQFLQAGWSATN